MRQSTAHPRASQPANSATSAIAIAKLLEKKKEFDAVSALEKASALYLERIRALGEDCDIMADAGLVHGQVLEQWPKMFQILSLFLNSRQDDSSEPQLTDGQRLVRIPIEDLQHATTEV